MGALSLALGLGLTNTPLKGVVGEPIRREANGSLTVLRLPPTWTPIVTREADGSMTITKAA